VGALVGVEIVALLAYSRCKADIVFLSPELDSTVRDGSTNFSSSLESHRSALCVPMVLFRSTAIHLMLKHALILTLSEFKNVLVQHEDAPNAHGQLTVTSDAFMVQSYSFKGL
jgi:hypothetical protein